MLNIFPPAKRLIHKPFNILVVDPNPIKRNYLKILIKQYRPYHNILEAEKLENAFSVIHEEIPLDLIFFDIESEERINNLALIKAIVPTVRLVNWSKCKQPEALEMLYFLGVRYFCFKSSQPKVIIDAIDYANNDRDVIYLDRQLDDCLSLLKN
jgi:DNA-binding NarL/FixJ family response regulator